MFEPLYTAEEMRRAEAGHDVEALMDRAGKAVADHVLTDYPGTKHVTVVCGGGSNGGDGRVAARYLEQAGCEVRLVDAKAGETELGGHEVLVDALFGTGFSGEPRPGAARLIETMNESDAVVVAVDVPSGVDASTGETAGMAVEATSTVTFHGAKVGHYVGPGAFLHGFCVEVADIGLGALDTHAHRVAGTDILQLVPRRSPRDNKYSAGSLLVVGGSRGMSGAAALASRAAFRADAGYVAIAAPAETLPVLETLVLEAVKRPLEDVFEAAAKANALAVGPGLGREEEAKALVRRLVSEVELPMVVDADALFELEPGDWPAPRVLTPHEGELARLLGRESKEISAQRLASVQEAAERFQAVVVLKGEDSLVAAPGRGVLVCALGLPSLSTAGTGDVLTGVTAAFLAKGMEAQRAAGAACAAQQLASREARQHYGLVASDVLEALPQALALGLG